MKYNIISHITTSCNYDCSYCDVIKDKQKISDENLENILLFIKNNHSNIDRFKFFGWEPLIAFNDIKYIINNTKSIIWNNYEIVTNTTLLNDEVWEYFNKYFKLIFFSIDSENEFNYKKISDFIIKYDLEEKLYFNLVISPWKEYIALMQFKNLYKLWFKGFNILPVYFTKSWSKKNLESLSSIMKYILDLSLEDKKLRLYWFRENLGEDTSLANNTFFIDIDNNIYYSDIVSTFKWNNIKWNLFLWKWNELDLWEYNDYKFLKEKEAISKLEWNIYNSISGQEHLHRIMDYFSEYLNKKNGK